MYNVVLLRTGYHKVLLKYFVRMTLVSTSEAISVIWLGSRKSTRFMGRFYEVLN